MARNGCGHGLYVVGWYSCSAWDTKDSRRSKTPNWDLGEAERWLADEAHRLTTHKAVLESFVLDVRLRDPPKPSSRKSPRSRAKTGKRKSGRGTRGQRSGAQPR